MSTKLSGDSLALSKPHLAPSQTGAARQAILAAVTALEDENAELRRYNGQILAELDGLRRENAELRRDLGESRTEKADVAGRFVSLEKDNRRLRHELENRIQALSQEKMKITNAERQLADENEHFRSLVEQLKAQIVQKDAEARAQSKNLEALRREVDKTAKVNLSDRDFEVMHELESLKTERKDLMSEREELGRANGKLRNELRNLEIQLDEQVAELKNENRRHSLLTKEFNSLLEENNHLKLQLRRRSQRNTVTRDDSAISASVPDASNALRAARKYNSSLSLNGRDPTSVTTINGDSRLPLRSSEANALSSRETPRRISRDVSSLTAATSARDTASNSSSFYAQPHSTTRELGAGGNRKRDQSREYDRRSTGGGGGVGGGSEHAHSTSPDTLPSIPSSGKTGMWKP